MSNGPHPYICEGCQDDVVLTEAAYKAALDPKGRFLCTGCVAKRNGNGSTKKRRRKTSGGTKETHGCIVTWRDADKHEHTVHEPGRTLTALRRIITPLPDDATVISISTPRSILRDVTKAAPVYGGRGRRNGTVDPYAHERQLLSKIGRLDLLPDDAYPRGRPQ